MPPTRRYLRLSHGLAIEVRIYLDIPADTSRWLLSARDPALPRIIQVVRPILGIKLREEDERRRGKGKKKGVKDVVTADDFQCSVFLTDASTPHSILRRDRIFAAPGPRRPKPGPAGSSLAQPLEIPADAGQRSDDEPRISIGQIPRAQDTHAIDDDDDDDDDDEDPRTAAGTGAESDDGKKAALQTSYAGFRIHGRILCLVVRRTGPKGPKPGAGSGATMLEEWITATQAEPGAGARAGDE